MSDGPNNNASGQGNETDSTTEVTSQPKLRLAPVLAILMGMSVLGFGAWRYWMPDQVLAPHRDAPLDATQNETPNPTEPTDQKAADPGANFQLPRIPNLAGLEPRLVELINERAAAAQENPDSADALGNLGVAYDAHGYVRLALDCYARAHALEPKEPKWRHLWAAQAEQIGLVQEAERAFRDVIVLQPDYAPAHYRLAKFLFDRKDLAEAEAGFQRVLALRPTEAIGEFWLAKVELARGNHERALAYLDQARTLMPNWKGISFLRGNALQGLGRSDEAEKAFARGKNAIPSTVRDPWREEVADTAVTRRARLRRANHWIKTGRTLDAMGLLLQLVKDDSGDREAVNLLARTYMKLERYEQARYLLETLLAVHPDDHDAHSSMADMYDVEGKLNQALMHAKRSTDAAPDNAQLFFKKGRLLARLRRDEEALASHREAARLDPSMAVAHAATARTLMRLDRWSEAVEPWEEAVKLRPDSSSYLFNLGLVYGETGRIDDAIKTLGLASSLSPKDPKIKRAIKQAMRLKHGR